MPNITKLYQGSTLLVDFTLYPLKSETVSPATLTSTLSGYVTTQSQASTLASYAQQSWVTQQIAATHHLKYLSVDTLPATGAADTIYLVSKVGDATTRIPYLYQDGVWVRLSETSISLTGYATESWVTGQLASYVKTTALTTTLAPYAKTADVTSAIATAKSEAISSAQGTASSLAATAKSEAISAAKAAADSTYTTTNAPLTQAAYNALPTKDVNRLYPIS